MRVTAGKVTRRRHKKVLAVTKGFRMTKHNLYKVANEAYMHAGQYAYMHRRRRPSQMRKIWIERISAAAESNGTNYSRFMKKLSDAKVELNRKVLADLAFNNPSVFSKIVGSF